MNRTIPLWSGPAPLFDAAAGQSAPSLTMFPAKNACGVVLILPGGGYDHKAAHEGAPIAERLNEGGISAAVLDYRVAPYKAPVPQWDAMRAVQLLRSLAPEYGCRQDRVAILGFSAGGHLAASVTYLDIPQPEISEADSLAGFSPRPDAAVLCYPVITMGAFTHQGSRNSLLGAACDAAAIRKWSVEEHIAPGAAPAFLWHTSEDGAVPVRNSLMMAEALAGQNVPFALHVWPHGRHGLGLAQDMPDVSRWPELAVEWLHSLGY